MLLALNKYDKFIYRLFEYLCSKHFHTFVPTTILTLQTNQSLHFVTDVTLLIGYLLLFASSPSKTISSTLKFLSFLFHYNELARLHGFPSSTWSKALLLSGTSIYIFPELFWMRITSPYFFVSNSIKHNCNWLWTPDNNSSLMNLMLTIPFVLYFCKQCQKQPPEMFYRKSCS